MEEVVEGLVEGVRELVVGTGGEGDVAGHCEGGGGGDGDGAWVGGGGGRRGGGGDGGGGVACCG